MTMLTQPERDMAAAMANELTFASFSVGLAPAPSPRHPRHRVRTVLEANPPWYRRLCALVVSARADAWRWKKVKTAIKRAHTIAALERMAKTGEAVGAYCDRLLPVIQAEIDSEAQRAAYEARLPRVEARSYIRERA